MEDYLAELEALAREAEKLVEDEELATDAEVDQTRLKRLDDEVRAAIAEWDPRPPPPQPDVTETHEKGELTSGTLVLHYTRSVVKRDELGRIVEIVGEGVRKTVRRDDSGRIVEILEETETEE